MSVNVRLSVFVCLLLLGILMCAFSVSVFFPSFYVVFYTKRHVEGRCVKICKVRKDCLKSKASKTEFPFIFSL